MITVFTSCFNQGAFLAQAIESVLSQSYEDFEYLLYDDGSDDNTWDIIQEYADKDKRIRPCKLDKQPNVGTVINRSFADALGDTWVWVPADDIIHTDLLKNKNIVASKYPNTVLYSYGKYIDTAGTEYSSLKPKCYSPAEFREVLKKTCPIGLTGIWIPIEVYSSVGNFPEHLKYSEDFYWMISACKAGVDFRCVPEYLYSKRHHLNRITERNRQRILNNIGNIRKEVGWL